MVEEGSGIEVNIAVNFIMGMIFGNFALAPQGIYDGTAVMICLGYDFIVLYTL